MLKVIFEHADGRREIHAGVAGETLLDVALDHGVAGIGGQCGGACTCVTCHCYLDSAWLNRVPAPQDDEREMLEYAQPRQINSRLACQIVITHRLEGIVIRIPIPNG